MEVKISNEAPKNVDLGKDLFKPRRNISKSFDFTSSNLSRQPDGLNHKFYSHVGSRFSNNGTNQPIRMGGNGVASPPRMRCYRPRMAESILIQALERYVTKDGLYSTLRDSTIKQS